MAHDERRRDWMWLGCLAGLAGVRMFLGAAALPFFANTDETAHFDVVVKYARNLVPVKEWDQYDIASAGMIVTHDSPHFFIPLDRLPSDQTPVPLWTLPAHVRQGYIGQWLQSARKNHEAYSPPVYYAIAASWYTLGATLGLQNGTLLYWSRFLNIPLFVGLVLAAHTFCVRIYPTRPWLRWSVPLLVAFFPQDVFYTINSDVLSPLAFLTAFFLLLSWDRRTIEDARLGLGAGVAVAATMLVKYSNVAIVLVLAVVLARKLFRQRSCLECLVACAGAALPLAAWSIYCRAEFGDWTGTEAKTELLGWSILPISQWIDHAVFSPNGLGYFLAELARRYWRGEVVWHLQMIANAAVDHFFVALSGTLLAAAAARAWLDNPPIKDEQRADQYALWAIVSSILFLFLLSIRFDFGACWYPSRDLPYFVSGRLIIGTLVPFLVLICSGWEFLVRRIPGRVAYPAGIVAIVALMVISRAEFLVTASRSSFNWFHLP